MKFQFEKNLGWYPQSRTNGFIFHITDSYYTFSTMWYYMRPHFHDVVLQNKNQPLIVVANKQQSRVSTIPRRNQQHSRRQEQFHALYFFLLLCSNTSWKKMQFYYRSTQSPNSTQFGNWKISLQSSLHLWYQMENFFLL